MTELDDFRSVYEVSGVYDRLLLPHYYHGREDIDLISDLMQQHHGEPAADLEIVEFGCGTGRVTSSLDPHARKLVVADYSDTMIEAATARFPRAETICADTRDAVTRLHADGRAGHFNVVGAFWSLSYPLGEFFETMTPTGIRPTADQHGSRSAAVEFVHDLLGLLASDGHMLALFFDADTPEQRLVTRQWERIAPFPEGGRRYTRDLLLDALREAEDLGHGTLTHIRYGGTALARDRDAAQKWFEAVHLKNHPLLVRDRQVRAEVAEFIAHHEQPDGQIAIPSGVHVIDFHTVVHPSCHLPMQAQR
ncbi:class I SAM-dependent methyltransferase [Nocardia australiensis]|uniref:class I SAM-dependent methyltransferase n=1 Tax=Nocardia australiensis TaxID=2887191 RepID=UPI001D140604|nr:class I SAM-dependent methyltransferase [Nocardia australiensis]